MILGRLLARLSASLRWHGVRAGMQKQLLTQARLVVVDVETSGLDTRRDHLLSIGAVAVTGGAVRPADSIEVVLRQAVESTHENILVHGIAGGQQRAGVPAAQAMRLFSAFVGADTLVAFHADFDRQFVERAARGVGVLPGLHTHWNWIDAAWLAPALLDRVTGYRRPLDDWCKAYGIAHVARHNAASDALATAELLLILLERAAHKGIRDVGALQTCARDEQRLARLQP